MKYSFLSQAFLDFREYLVKILVLVLANIETTVLKIMDIVWKMIQCRLVSLGVALLNTMQSFLRIPLVIIYYLYVVPTLFIIRKMVVPAVIVLGELTKYNKHFDKLQKSIPVMYIACENTMNQILAMKVADVVPFCVTIISEIIETYLYPRAGVDRSASLSDGGLDEVAELLAYEELDEQLGRYVQRGAAGGVSDNGLAAGDADPFGGTVSSVSSDNRPVGRGGGGYYGYKRPASVRLMHNYVSTAPFKATVRIVRSRSNSSASTRGRSSSRLVAVATGLEHSIMEAFRSRGFSWGAPEPLDSALDGHNPPPDDDGVLISLSHSNPTDVILSSDILAGADSPASFPATPFSRAFVMNKASEKVVSVMFAARDRLRLEAQSVSRDEYSRLAAREAKTSGQLAVFDANQASAGIALTCGNHCATKVGKGLCCSIRSMAPVRTNAYVYFEMSITVSSAQVPTLGIGLSPLDCPLNVMVGSWPRSAGIYTDGQLQVGSHWYQSLSGQKSGAGSTVGVLVHISAPTSAASTAFTSPANSSSAQASSTFHASCGIAGVATTGMAQSHHHHPSLNRVRDSHRVPPLSPTAARSPMTTKLSPLYETKELRAAAGLSVSSSGADSARSSDSTSYECRVEPAEVQSKQTEQATAPVATAAASTPSPVSRIGAAGGGRPPSLLVTSLSGPAAAVPPGYVDSEVSAFNWVVAPMPPATTARSALPPVSPVRRAVSLDTGAAARALPAGFGLAPIVTTMDEPAYPAPVPSVLKLHFNINGSVVAYPAAAAEDVGQLVTGASCGAALYPTVSIFSEETRVWCRFCEADVVYRRREQIGAPPGVRVYCLDGSLLLKENE